MSADNRTHFFIRLPATLKLEVQRVAKRHGRSATREVERVLQNHVEKYASKDRELVGHA
jgi:hypothetical protein